MIEIQKTRITETKAGKVEGFHAQNPAYTVFKGIPYAAPPVGPLRFQPPQESEPWRGVRPCFRYAPAPIQRQWKKGEFYQVEFYPVDKIISEDCLYLNVWTPAETSEERHPVMVWYHGGGFGSGSADEMPFDGEAFARRGIVLVTVGYRVNIFSAFVSIENGVYGNFGSKDQLAALRWVQENIENFGGDPKNVTIFGQSAGGASVQALLATRYSRGLFSKAIIQSAGGIHTLGGKRTVESADRDFSEMMNYLNLDFETMQTMPAEKLFDEFCRYTQETKRGINCYPNADGDFLLDSPGNLAHKGEFADVPIMTGTEAGDSGFFTSVRPQTTYEEQVKAIREYYGDCAQEFLDRFLPDESHFASFSESLHLVRCVGAAEAFAKNRIQYGTQPVYLYHFNRVPPGNDGNRGYHSFQLWYIFGTLQHSWRPFVGVDYELSDMMTDYWASFAACGDPNHTRRPYPEWTAYTQASPKTLQMNDHGTGMINFEENALVNTLTQAPFTVFEK